MNYKYLLGLVDSPVKISDLTLYDNRIGGPPIWMIESCDFVNYCANCGDQRVLVVQLYCPLQDQARNRAIHLFVCPNADCRSLSQSWVLYRSESDYVPESDCSLPPSAAVGNGAVGDGVTAGCSDDGGAGEGSTAEDWANSMQDSDDDDWCAGGDPNDDSEDDDDSWLDNADCFSSAKSSEKKSCHKIPTNEHKTSPKILEIPLPYKDKNELLCQYVNVVEEAYYDTPNNESQYSRENQLFRDYCTREGISSVKNMLAPINASKNGTSNVEDYEKNQSTHINNYFKKYLKIISKCPQQIIRYSLGGCPLYTSEPVTRDHGSCDHCGGERTFEFQLLSSSISFLKFTTPSSPKSEFDSDFANIIAYTCKNSCAASKNAPLEEYLVVEFDDPCELKIKS